MGEMGACRHFSAGTQKARAQRLDAHVQAQHNSSTHMGENTWGENTTLTPREIRNVAETVLQCPQTNSVQSPALVASRSNYQLRRWLAAARYNEKTPDAGAAVHSDSGNIAHPLTNEKTPCMATAPFCANTGGGAKA